MIVNQNVFETNGEVTCPSLDVGEYIHHHVMLTKWEQTYHCFQSSLTLK
jgi:hypothetical protein